MSHSIDSSQSPTLHRESVPLEKRPPCAGLWSTPMVHVNGDVTTCCLDEHLVNRIGNLTQQSLDEIWNSPRMNRWRMAHVQGEFEKSGPLCTKCNWRSAGAYPNELAEQWQREFEAKVQAVKATSAERGLLKS